MIEPEIIYPKVWAKLHDAGDEVQWQLNSKGLWWFRDDWYRTTWVKWEALINPTTEKKPALKTYNPLTHKLYNPNTHELKRVVRCSCYYYFNYCEC